MNIYIDHSVMDIIEEYVQLFNHNMLQWRI